MKLKNTLLMAAFGLIMSAYSVQTTHAQMVTVQAAKATSTPISSLPSNIVAPGTYALTRNLNYPAGQTIPAIVIANNLTGAVVVDLKASPLLAVATSVLVLISAITMCLPLMPPLLPLGTVR